MPNALVNPPRTFVELAAYPKPGMTIVLPIGLKYFNEYYNSAHVTKREHDVTIVEVDRGELYWKLPNGEKCFTRWRRRAA